MKQKLILLFVATFLLLGNTYGQAATFASYCNYIAANSGRFNVQYQGDISPQRCSFCQFFEQPSGNYATYAQGCANCPSYTTGTCSTCKSNWVQTFANVCIVCPPGTTCCAGNNPQSDANLKLAISTQVKSTNPQEVLTQTFTTLTAQQYIGLRQMTCLSGYFQIGHKCEQMPPNCANVLVQGTYYYCSQCKPGYYFNNSNGCVQSCNAQYVQKDGSKIAVSACTACNSTGNCSQCGTLNNYAYTLDNTASTSELSTDMYHDPSKATTEMNLQFCKQCPVGCANCDGTIYPNCNTCKAFYFLQSGLCTACTAPDATLIVIPDKDPIQISNFYSACSASDSLKTSSYTWNASFPSGYDTIGLPINRPILQIPSTKQYTVCGTGCINCTVDNGAPTTSCSNCANGYYLDPTKKSCIQCPDANSVLCTYNTDLAGPQITACVSNPTDVPPYANTYYLQYDFALSKFATTNKQNYVNTAQCVLNVNRCKAMINTYTQTTPPAALCSSCYTSTDYAVGSGVTATSYYLPTPSNICQSCQNQGTATCGLKSDNSAVETKTCSPGYQPKPLANGTCNPCPGKCLTCDDNSKCTSCNAQIYVSITTNGAVTDCALTPYAKGDTTPTTNWNAAMDGCVNWGSNPGVLPALPPCTACKTGFVLTQSVTYTDSKANTVALCLACPAGCANCNSGSARNTCTSCIAGYYLSNNVCLEIPIGCVQMNNSGVCTYCKYGYRLVNNSQCTPCASDTFKGPLSSGFFDCPQAQCVNLVDDNSTSSSSSSSSSILSMISISCLLIASLFI